jgi:Tfp pilus assembly PilM family ATPase
MIRRMLGIHRSMPIGLDLGTACIKACQLRRLPSGAFEAAALMLVPRRPSEPMTEIAQRLPEMLARHGFVGRDLVLAVPPEARLLSMLQVPPASSGAPLATIVRNEFARAHKREASKLEIAWWELPLTDRATDGGAVIAVGCGHEQSSSLLEPFDRAGFRVRAIDLAAAALGRACAGVLAPEPCINAVVDLGWSCPNLVLMRGTKIVYLRELPEVGLVRVQARLKERLRLGEDEALALTLALTQGEKPAFDPDLILRLDVLLAEYASSLTREIDLSMRYALHRYPGGRQSRVLLVGGGAHLPMLTGDLRTALGCEVVAPCLGDLVGSRISGPGAASGEFALAAGLSAHPCESQASLRSEAAA